MVGDEELCRTGGRAMICLIEYIYWEATEKVMECKGKDCRWYGGLDCHAKEAEDE